MAAAVLWLFILGSRFSVLGYPVIRLVRSIHPGATLIEASFLQSLREQPDDTHLRLVFADWLEERGDLRGELLRLTHLLTEPGCVLDRAGSEARLRTLLACGVQPVGPRWTNGLGMEFVWIPPGGFVMGSPLTEALRHDAETPHPVTLTRGFYLGVTAVTQVQWRAVLGENPSAFHGDQRPVEGVSWDDCQQFCQELTRKDGLSPGLQTPYRLPTEAEWEYACRAGTSSAYFFGDALAATQAQFHAHYLTGKGDQIQRQQTALSGQFAPNAWGLHDMHGNVYEWCADGYTAYPETAVTDPLAADRDVRVLRGGSWHSLAARCRSACRGWSDHAYRGSDVGCRICFRVDYTYSI